MPKDTARARARLGWEAACERLRDSMDPPPGSPLRSREERIFAFAIARSALEELARAFEADRLAEGTPHHLPLRDGPEEPDSPGQM